MAKFNPRVSAAVLALAIAGAGASTIATQYISEHEGLSLKAYQDGAKVWTICRGHTKGVTAGMQATIKQCNDWFKTEVGSAYLETSRIINPTVLNTMSETRMAAIVSFCGYNLGIPKCQKSTFIQKINSGDVTACNEVLKWMYVGGKDCRIASNNCCGIPKRRLETYTLCGMVIQKGQVTYPLPVSINTDCKID